MERQVFLGVDIGKSAHYALAVDQVGRAVHQQPVANDEAGLRELVQWAVEHHAALIVDQPGGAAALLLQLCWAAGVIHQRTGRAQGLDRQTTHGRMDTKRYR